MVTVTCRLRRTSTDDGRSSLIVTVPKEITKQFRMQPEDIIQIEVLEIYRDGKSVVKDKPFSLHIDGHDPFYTQLTSEMNRLETNETQLLRHIVEAYFRNNLEQADVNRMIVDVEDATIGKMADMIGHDLRNPLQAIQGAIYFARDKLQEPPPLKTGVVQEMLDIIEEQSCYMSKIVLDLQDYSRLLKPELRRVHTLQFIKGAISKISIPDNIRTDIKVGRNLQTISIDPSIVRRVLTNLVNNSLQAMPEGGGELTIRAQRKKNAILITVSDTGIGMADDVKSKLFTPLFTTKAKGQGFGLAVCKRMMEAHGGEITFESEEGKGTTFTVKIPQ